MERGPFRRATAPRAVFKSLLFSLFLSLFLLSSCGGGGGGGEPDGDTGDVPVEPSVLGLFRADLSGANETTVRDPDASGQFLVEILDDATIRYAAVAESGYLPTIVGMHIHRGAAGEDGPIVVDLLPSGVGFDPATRTASGEIPIDAPLMSEIVGDPAAFYVNVHTEAAPAGFVRGQLAPFGTAELSALLRGSEEVVVLDSSARGASALTFHEDLSVDYVIAMKSPSAADVIDAHVHLGPVGVSGGVVVDLDTDAATLDPAKETLAGSTTVGLDVLARILTMPAGYYVNVHTAAAPAGIARGQLEAAPREFWATLRGDEEPTVVDPTARGGFVVRFFSLTEGVMMLAVPPAQGEGIDGITAAHIHEGGSGTTGDPVVDLMAGDDFGTGFSTGSAEGAVELTPELFARILADPASFYVNAHTLGAPGGLVRGQLTTDPLTFTTVLDGENETTVVDPDAGGAVKVIFDGMASCSFLLSMDRPDAGTLIGGHIHDGPAGTDGSILIDLLGGDTSISGNVVTGEVAFTGRTFARIIAAPELFYVNVHSPSAPAGIARGQLVRVTQDTPPTVVQYQSPVVYETGGNIDENVPLTFGGAITRYDVSPALPAGLRLHALTGAIYGVPTTVTSTRDYRITASNKAGSVEAVVRVEVISSRPAGLSYTTPVSYPEDVAITPNSPTSTGGTITQYSVSPSLPAGLKIDSSTGVISGTPTTPTAAADYTVTGQNNSGSTTAVVRIEITEVLQAPANLSYSTPVTYSTGSAITPNKPSVGGGPVSSWSVSPALPAGLSLSSTDGSISGTPTTVTSAANYTVTATNGAGSTTAVVRIEVQLGAPVSVSYSNNPNIGYVKGGSFSSMTPTVTGGQPTSYSISPALSAGLSLNTSTGVISGSPTVTTKQINYTVTASNSAGSTTATVTITVYP